VQNEVRDSQQVVYLLDLWFPEISVEDLKSTSMAVWGFTAEQIYEIFNKDWRRVTAI
jgi:hypothetical protein